MSKLCTTDSSHLDTWTVAFYIGKLNLTARLLCAPYKISIWQSCSFISLFGLQQREVGASASVRNITDIFGTFICSQHLVAATALPVKSHTSIRYMLG